MTRLVLPLAVAALLPAALLSAQEEKPIDQTALAKQTQNPVADLVSIPFQFNFNTGGGLNDGTLFNLNVQPVIPIKLSKDWNLIFRGIIPFLSTPTADGGQVSGIGDLQLQHFLSPAHPGKIIWGLGPIFSAPAATNPAFRTGAWAVGPTAVVLAMPANLVLGLLANQLWTFAQSGDGPDVNQLLIQPFVNYNFGRGWAIVFSPIITANWSAPSGQEWTVPLGIGFSRTTAFNRTHLITLGAQYYHNVVHPDAGPSNQFRVQLSLLYPSHPPVAKPSPGAKP